MQLNETALHEAVNTTLDALVGSAGEAVDPTTPNWAMRALIEISGDFDAVVSATCDEHFARSLAAAMFGLELDETSDDDVRDAFGEFTNIAGGMVKSLLPGTCRMSVPSVGDPTGVGEPSAVALLCEAAVEHEGGHVGVRVLSPT